MTLNFERFRNIFVWPTASHFYRSVIKRTIKKSCSIMSLHSRLGVKVRNMKMDLNIYGTWRQVGQ